MFWNKRKRLHKKWVRLSQDWFGTPTWPPFHCFGTPIWPPFHCFGTLIRPSWLGLLQGTGKQNRQIADRRVPRSQKQLCRTSSVIQSYSRFLSGESVSAVRTCLRSDLFIWIGGICLDCKLFPPHYWFTTARSVELADAGELAVALAAKEVASWLLWVLRVLCISSIRSQNPQRWSSKCQHEM